MKSEKKPRKCMCDYCNDELEDYNPIVKDSLTVQN